MAYEGGEIEPKELNVKSVVIPPTPQPHPHCPPSPYGLSRRRTALDIGADLPALSFGAVLAAVSRGAGASRVLQRRDFVKLLLVLRHPFFIKNFAAGVDELLRRGHEVEICFSEPPKGRVGDHLAAEARNALPGVKVFHFDLKASAEAGAVEVVSVVLDTLRYDTPTYADSKFLRDRARKMAAAVFGGSGLLKQARAVTAREGYHAANEQLMALLDGLPPPPRLVSLLREGRYDAIIVSPVTPFGSEQANYFLAARALGIPALYSMYSWDNLTNKGLLRPRPDAGIVWNASHVDEAVKFHGMEAERMFMAGAPGYDIWFDTKPSMDRETFCRSVGLDPGVPFLLYTCSSGSIARELEASFIADWIAALRTHPDPDVARIGVLVRPHPQNADVFRSFDEMQFENVVVHPRAGAIPFAGTAREEFYCSIAYSLAVVGVNTSAMVEAAIIDRPIIAFESDVFGEGHLGTPHYRQLLTYEFLIRTPTLADNTEAIARLVHGDPALLGYSRTGNARFVDQFIRPGDRTRKAALRWAEAVEKAFALAKEKGSRTAAPASTLGSRVAFSGWVNAYLADHAKRVVRGGLRRFRGLRRNALVRRGITGVSEQVSRRARRAHAIYVHLRLFGVHGLPLTGEAFVAERERKRKALSEKGLVARIFDKGPFRAIEQIEEAFRAGSSPPDAVLLGDSVHYRVRYNDRDGRTLAEMTGEDLAPLRMLSLAGSAYHPRLYLALVRAILAMPERPRCIVVPVNIRCFSPQWWLRPENAYEAEVEALEKRRPGDPAPVLPPYEKNRDLDRYRAMDVRYPGVPLTKIGQFLDIVDSKVTDPAEKNWRSRHIAVFHYMHPLESGHPWLADLRTAIAEAVAANIRPLVYVTPINHQWGQRAAGAGFSRVVDRNLAILREALAPLAEDGGGRYEDWALAFRDGLFFNKDEKTEHLSDAGRRELAMRIAGLVRRGLESERPQEAAVTAGRPKASQRR
jgi:hypothetical protein